MSAPTRRGFADRPLGRSPNADAWVQAEAPTAAPSRAELYPARLTIDVTKALRARIKIAAFAQGQTVADLLRELLETRFPAEPVDGARRSDGDRS